MVWIYLWTPDASHHQSTGLDYEIFFVGDPYKSSFCDCWLGVDPSNGIDQLIHVSIFGGMQDIGKLP